MQNIFEIKFKEEQFLNIFFFHTHIFRGHLFMIIIFHRLFNYYYNQQFIYLTLSFSNFFVLQRHIEQYLCLNTKYLLKFDYLIHIFLIC